MGSSRMPFVGGNWKMNTDLASAVELAEDVVAALGDVPQHCDVALYPPYPYLQAVGRALGHHAVLLGAQDVFSEPEGAYTGEVSAGMLVDLNVAVVLVGHSERRHVIGETDEIVADKLRAALDAGLWAVLCVGETLEQREAGETEAVNVGQLRAALDDVPAEQLRQLSIAYEPVWAIGTGHTAAPEDAQAVHRLLRATLADLYDEAHAQAVRIQYGGSVKPANAADLFAGPDVDGGLVGGASLDAEGFASICRSAVEAARAHDHQRTT